MTERLDSQQSFGMHTFSTGAAVCAFLHANRCTCIALSLADAHIVL